MVYVNLISDQTPTPTRFLKNCEEVGLFNELASPFENEFKKASEDDIKKVSSCKFSFQSCCSIEKSKSEFICCLLNYTRSCWPAAHV